uniref:Uncharacterized protein n=1 Tax=Anguilla anguilla TaxID=7936 RepID=A0A0E9XJT1_ANGAN
MEGLNIYHVNIEAESRLSKGVYCPPLTVHFE